MQKVLHHTQSDPEIPETPVSGNVPEGGWSDALGGFADNPEKLRTSGETIHALGREFVISRVEQGIKAQYEELLIKKAKYWINRTRREEGEEAFVDELSALVADRAAGKYSWNGRNCRKALSDFPGLIMLLYLLLRRCYGNAVTMEIAEQIMEDNPKEALEALKWAQGNLPGSSANGGKEMTSQSSMTTMDG